MPDKDTITAWKYAACIGVGTMIVSWKAFDFLEGRGAHQQSSEENRFFSRLAGALLSRSGSYQPGMSAKSSHVKFPKVDPPILEERGEVVNTSTGERTTSEERLFMQLSVIDVVPSSFDEAVEALKRLSGDMSIVLYADASSASGIGILTWDRDPVHFVAKLNPLLQALATKVSFTERKGWSMIGRTYSAGHEKDLQDFLFKKPVRAVLHPDRPWAVWYPMRRDGAFYMLPPAEQCRMLLHHAAIGKSYAEVGAAHDVRLACHGLDGNDNEFVVGLVGKELFGLSKIVQDMRKTEHTSHYLKQLGPFFVGYKLWQNGTVKEA